MPNDHSVLPVLIPFLFCFALRDIFNTHLYPCKVSCKDTWLLKGFKNTFWGLIVTIQPLPPMLTL